MLFVLPQRFTDPAPQSLGWSWARSHDGQTLDGHGEVEHCTDLPTDTQCVLVVPLGALSWHTVAWPKIPASQRQAALRGLLEERLLAEPDTLHFALGPEGLPEGGQQRWVMVCDAAALQGRLQELQNAQRAAVRVTPALAPTPTRQCHLQTDAGQHWLCITDPENGVWRWPVDTAAPPSALPTDWVSALGDASQCVTNASGLGWAETHWPALAWTLAPGPQTWLQTAQQGWDLTQFGAKQWVQAQGWAKGWRRFWQGPEWRAVRRGGAALLVVQLLGFKLWAWQQERDLARLQQDTRQQLQQTFPQIALVLDAPRQMALELDKLRQQHGALRPQDLESVLGVLGQHAPELRWQSLVFAEQGLQLHGLYQAPADLGPLRHHLQGLGWQLDTRSDREWHLQWQRR